MHWVPDAQLIVETDASDYTLAAILSIMTKNNEIHPVAFHSRTFSAPELNYDVHNKELLAIFEVFKIWQHYLEGVHFTNQHCNGSQKLGIFLNNQDPNMPTSKIVRISLLI